MLPFWLFAVYATVVGLLVGSYLNVLIHRLPRDESTVVSRSRCPHCSAPIRPWDNVPLLSYLVLLGRCRACKTRISPRYPLVEALTGALFLACFLRFGPTVGAVGAATFCALSVALAFIDVEHFLLPDKLTLPGLVAGLAFATWLPWTSLQRSALGALLGGGGLLALYGLWYALRREEGMGLGDVKMLAMQGAFLGWPGVLLTLLLSAVAGAAVGVALLARGGTLKTQLPFGTFLAAGGVATLFFGPQLIAWYASLF